jgi:hypothetical protein
LFFNSNIHNRISLIAGKYFTGEEDETHRKIPLLKHVFESFPGVVVNIDVKQGGDELIEEIDKLITAHNREKSTIWGSFKEESSLKCYYQASFRNNGVNFIIYV